MADPSKGSLRQTEAKNYERGLEGKTSDAGAFPGKGETDAAKAGNARGKEDGALADKQAESKKEE